MKVFKEIDIAEPIWKFKAVGLAIDDVPMGESVRVTISYKSKKTGKQIYPGEYDIEVDKIRTYPIEKVRGNTRVHIVPIADLAKLVINHQKQSKMLFGSEELSKIVKESEEAKAGNYDNKKMITPGKYIMTMVDIKLDYAKDKNPMIVAEFALDDEHRTIREFMKIAGPNTEIPRQKLVKLLHRGFGYEIQACKDEAGLMSQIEKFKGQKISIAVKGKKAAYCFEKDGKDIVMEQTYPEFWYCDNEAEFPNMSFDESKAIKPLSEEDKEKLVRFAEMNGGPYVPAKKEESAPASTPEPTPAPAQPEAQAVQPTPAPAAEAPAQAAQPVEQVPAQQPTPEQPDPEAKGDDDFPF